MNKNLLRKIELFFPAPPALMNQYKRRDVFRCTHETHLRFNSAVSVYHVLEEKKCFPQGCICFKWRCKKLNKGEPCPRKYKHVGRTCSNCRYFYDIKLIKRPETLLPQKEFEQFQKDLKTFESWLKSHQRKRVEFSGTVNSVKPRFSLRTAKNKSGLVFEGFLLNFREGTVNSKLFHDFIYVPISSRMQARFCFGKGDSVVFSGFFCTRNGSVVLRKIRGTEILDRGDPCFWTASRARVAQRTGSILRCQSEKCYACDKGILLHAQSDDGPGDGVRRRMFCLEGIKDPEGCCYRLYKDLNRQKGPGGEALSCLSNG